MNKRTKINFKTINNGNFKIIDPKLIAEANKRIKQAMSKLFKK
jgi:hypothetical protein